MIELARTIEAFNYPAEYYTLRVDYILGAANGYEMESGFSLHIV